MSRLALLPLSLLLILGGLPQRPSTAGKLADDGRAASVMEVQGTALVRPAGRERWTPLGPKSVLFPGDVLRTDARGAHALEVRTPTGDLLIGPGALVELPSDGGVRLLRGEMEAAGSADAALRVRGPGGFAREVKGTAWLRTKEGATEVLEKTPRWIEGYRSSSSNEWMGSLLAKVDGRDVPLAVGYHKVDAEIRDQIARTTVEQSFLNTTGTRLEGVFYFPLPADASISGFGMWIGGELVEADIVERQRARQIYEDILRRKKDPGLLEWEGGNLFKARVFPIEAHSEKRIRIRYTQVLPLTGSTMRYRYGLRSELLRSKPLRELQLTVRVVSDTPIQEVGSPTHDVLTNATSGEATVQFKASEYRPEKDFEVAIRLQDAAALTAIPHRRGDDGYFMLLLAPPDEEAGRWKRELAPDGEPLHVLVLADTSGSMDEGARRAQTQFIGGLLGVLSEKDRVSLAACDTDVVWLTAAPTAPADAEEALDKLTARRSLGWTDIERALGGAFEKATDNTIVVYVGDGVGTTGDADPNALAERIDALGKGKTLSVHAVAPSSSYEAPVLNAMARIGGGSVRETGDRPARSAFALLSEAARPALRDIHVEIEGIRTARVYPRRLPNLPLGAQQIVLGRYLPTGEAQQGRVVVSGTRAGTPVRFKAALSVPAGDAGNSFLPRLWGRRHIDALLEQGSGPKVQEEVVAFSERFGIMTPYTSFLVLESDEDRAKYGVERRVRMRDGERFFAEARDQATLEKRRALMKAAGNWRVALRRQALREIARLGRDLPINLPPQATVEVALAEIQTETRLGALSAGEDRSGSFRTTTWGDSAGGDTGVDFRFSSAAAAPSMRAPSDPTPPPPGSAPVEGPARSRRLASKGKKAGMPESEEELLETVDDFEDVKSYAGRRENLYRGQPRSSTIGFGGGSRGRLDYRGGRWRTPSFTLGQLGFPPVPPALKPDEGGEGEPWNEEVLTILRSLVRRGHVGSVEGGLHFAIQHENLHATRSTVLGANRIEGWIGATRWRLRSETGGAGEPREDWLENGSVGALAVARRLARTRVAEAGDANAWWLPIWDLQSRDVIRQWRRGGYRARIVSKGDGTVRIALEKAPPSKQRVELLVDPGKRILLERVDFDSNGRPSSTTRYADPVEAGGRLWAQRVERFDRKDRLISRSRVSVRALAEGELEAQATQAAAGLGNVITIHGTLPKTHEAKQALHEKRARFLDHLVLALGHGQRQQWKPALAAWDAAESLVADKPGRRWIRTEFLTRSRQGPALKRHLEELSQHVGAKPGPATRFLARLLYGRSGVLGPTERGALLEDLKERWIDATTPAAARRREAWLGARAGLYTQAGRERDALRVARTAAEAFPHSVSAQLLYEPRLWSTGRHEAATKLLHDLLANREPWLETERDSIYWRLTDRLWERRHLAELHTTLTSWMKQRPANAQAWGRWLSSFYFLGNEAEADAKIAATLRSRPADEADEHVWARLAASVDLALGRGWNFHSNRIETAWQQPLADLCHHLWRDVERDATPAQRIFSDWRFTRTDAYRALLTSLRADVTADGAVESMPVGRLQRYVDRLAWSSREVDEAVWRRTVDRIRARWAETKDQDDRRRLGEFVQRLFDARQRREEAITFARERLASTDESARAARALDLYRRLLTTPARDEHQTPEREDEVVALLPRLIDPQEAPETTRAEIARRVRSLAAKLYSWRYERGIGTPEERAPLSRAALKVRRKEARQAARDWLSARLAKAESAADERHKPWLQLERLGYGVEAGHDLEAIVAEASAILGGDWKREAIPLDRLVRERAAVILAYAATRRNAAPDLADTVLGILTAGDEADAKARAADPESIELLDWRRHGFRLLVALDRAEQLETALLDWIVPAEVESRWRIALGYLYAETGRVQEAADQFEEVHALGELGQRDYEALADWHLVLGDDKRREVALDARYDHMNEYELSTLVWRLQNRMRSRASGVPGDFDPEILRVLKAMMRKARHPANYANRVRNLYRTTKDFRTLASLTEGLVGHTKEGVYPFLGKLTNLLSQVHEEATLDTLREHLAKVGADATVPLDRRALQLATALVAGRASLVQEKDPAHGARALAALKAAFQEDWQPGEPRLMAQFLRQLGTARDQAVQDEQLRQLEALRVRMPAGSLERLHIAHAQSQTLWSYNRRDRAVAVLGAALQATRSANNDRIPMAARAVFDTYANWLSELGRYRDAEREIQQELDHWDLPQRRRGLQRFLYEHYVKALWAGGSVSLGRGSALFTAVRDRIEATMRDDPAHLGVVLNVFGDLHRQAKRRGTPANAGRQLVEFAHARFPAILARVPMGASNHVEKLARVLRELDGPAAGIRFVLERRDAEPTWLARMNRDVWHECHRELARWRREAGRLDGALEKRLFALVDAELERNLKFGGNTGSSFWTRKNKWFWAQRAGDFAATADRVAELNAASEATVMRCANVLHDRLGFGPRGIALLQASHARGLLGESSRWTLASWLLRAKRFADALPLTQTLVEERPDKLGYRVHLIQVLAGSKRADEARTALDATETRWREQKHWSESVAARLGRLAAKYRLSERALRLMEEAIRLRQEARGHRGGVDGTLARYYADVARARGQLGQTAEALRAASSSILATGTRNRGRYQGAVKLLDGVLADATSLPAYIETYEGEVREKGLDAPVLRKAFARAFTRRGNTKEALRHLLIARDLEAGDPEIHTAIVAAYDALGDGDGARNALFGSIRLAPHGHGAYRDLAARFRKAGDTASAERALTTLAEMAPNQPDGHRVLAGIREKQARLDDAVVQWRQVVRTGALDPTGWIALAKALMAQQPMGTKEAREALEHVLQGTWEKRFGDVKKEAAGLHARLP